MASINYAARQISVKIVYYGPGLSGKTTNLQVIHKKTPQEYRNEMVSLATEGDRTLFFDFMPLDLGKIKQFDTKFQLYTVPGQVYYNATRKLVLRGVDGVVFVADSGADKIQENLESFQNLEDNLAEYGYQRDSIPIIIQYNKRDLPNALPVEELQRHINKYNLPYGEGIAYKGVGVFDTLKQIGKIVIDHLNKKYSRGGGSRPGGVAAPPPQPQYTPPPAPQYQAPPAAPQYAPPPAPPQYQAPPAAPQYQAPQYQPPAAPQYQAPPPAQSWEQSFQQQPYAPPAPPQYAPSAPPAPPVQQYAPPAPAAAQSWEQPPVNFEISPAATPAAAPAAAEDPFYVAPAAAHSWEQSAAPVNFAPPPQAAAQSWDHSPAAQSFEINPISAPAVQAAPPAPQPWEQPAAPMNFEISPAAPAAPPPTQAFDNSFFAPPAPPASSEIPNFDFAPAASIPAPSFDDPFLTPSSAPAPSFDIPSPAPAFEMPAQGFEAQATIPSFEFETAPASPAPPPPPSINFDDAFAVSPQPPVQASGFDLSAASAPVGFDVPAAPAPAGFGAPVVPPPSSDAFVSFEPPAAPAGFGAPVAPSSPGGFGAPVQGGTPFDYPPPPPPPQQGGRSELDLEIEKYQREIEEKQKKMRSAGMPPPARPANTHEMQPYPGPSDNRYQSPFQAAPAATGAMPDMHSAYSDFEAELEGRGTSQISVDDGMEEYPSDSAMFFTSVDKNTARFKKPVKPPVNPAKRAAQAPQTKGFFKFFNKDQQG